MNVKKAKALRKALGFKPSAERVYDILTVFSSMGRVTRVPGTRVNHEKSLRAKYQALKNARRKWAPLPSSS